MSSKVAAMSVEHAITVAGVSKTYRLYKRNSDRIRETFHPLRKQYHRPFTALDEVSFSIKRGESVGIIGKNGSGKSTLLQILCGVLQPSAGNVSVNGRISALLELGAGFNPEFTGRENVYLSATIMGLSRDYVDYNIKRIFAFADIGEYVDQPVKLYSSGMYVRLAFATAINVEPEILIVDEALAVGDIFFQQKCVAHMKEMQKNATIVFVTHDMHAVTNLCRRVILLDGGKVLFDGEPIDGVAKYTKLVHNERFQEKKERENEAGGKEAVESPQVDDSGWMPVSAEDRGGALEIEILKVKVSDEQGELKETAVHGDLVVVHLQVYAARVVEQLIVGYTVKDRLGNAIFGENTCSSLAERFAVDEGKSVITYSFIWPEVYPEQYTLTFGIGEGTDPFVHKIHCWAHNVASVAALVVGKGVHGIFNNPIRSCEIRPLPNP
jgi:ABC-type polysaccharide/polyol phosphate transport system ATPase subunit